MEFKNLSRGGKSGFAYTAFIILYVLFTLLIQAISGIFLLADSVYYRLLCSLALPISVTIVTALFSVSEKRKLFNVAGVTKFNPVYFIPAGLIVVGMFFGLGFVNVFVNGLLKYLGLNLTSTPIPLGSRWNFSVMVFALAVLPAIFEEALFRGIMREYLDGVKNVYAILLVGVSFALFHGSITQFVYQFIYGCMLTWLAIKAGSVIPCVFAHFANNFLILILTYFLVEIDFYNGLIIAGGLVALLCAVAFMLFFNKTKASATENKQSVIGFSIFASVGWLITLILIICGMFI